MAMQASAPSPAPGSGQPIAVQATSDGSVVAGPHASSAGPQPSLTGASSAGRGTAVAQVRSSGSVQPTSTPTSPAPPEDVPPAERWPLLNHHQPVAASTSSSPATSSTTRRTVPSSTTSPERPRASARRRTESAVTAGRTR